MGYTLGKSPKCLKTPPLVVPKLATHASQATVFRKKSTKKETTLQLSLKMTPFHSCFQDGSKKPCPHRSSASFH